jgi:hypothetical protein
MLGDFNFLAASNYSFIDYDGVRLTSQNRSRQWPIIHSLGECEWRAIVGMLAGDNS